VEIAHEMLAPIATANHGHGGVLHDAGSSVAI